MPIDRDSDTAESTVCQSDIQMREVVQQRGVEFRIAGRVTLRGGGLRNAAAVPA